MKRIPLMRGESGRERNAASTSGRETIKINQDYDYVTSTLLLRDLKLNIILLPQFEPFGFRAVGLNAAK
eukprot:scaffold75330_cov48-Prasinocladus_malaysianus.AAC.1